MVSVTANSPLRRAAEEFAVMHHAAARFAACAALVLLGFAAACGAADSVAVRTVPTRPGQTNAAVALPVTRVDGVEYYDLERATARLGLKLRGRDGKKFVYGDNNSRLVIDEGRDISVDGSKVFLGTPVIARQGRLLVGKIDFEACLAPLLAPELVAAEPILPKVITLDAGHGGSDNGMLNPRLGMKEKDFTLDVALRLKRILETAGCKVVLTRKDDRELAPDKLSDLRKRTEIANRAKSDLFVSIHFNALEKDTKTGGTEVYTFTRAFQRSDESAGAGKKDDAEREPAPVNRFDPWNTLLGQSIKLALLRELKTFDRGSKTMHSGVLRGLNCPGVLVESVFLSNDAEAKLVKTPAYRQQIAQGIADGIRAYADTLEKLRIKPAATAALGRPSNSP
jgi:N-acetylmuramoyl-L-alanine amidase